MKKRIIYFKATACGYGLYSFITLKWLPTFPELFITTAIAIMAAGWYSALAIDEAEQQEIMNDNEMYERMY